MNDLRKLYSETSENRNKIVTNTGIYRQTTAKCSMPALQNVPLGALCNASMLRFALKCGENTPNHIFKISIF